MAEIPEPQEDKLATANLRASWRRCLNKAEADAARQVQQQQQMQQAQAGRARVNGGKDVSGKSR